MDKKIINWLQKQKYFDLKQAQYFIDNFNSLSEAELSELKSMYSRDNEIVNVLNATKSFQEV